MIMGLANRLFKWAQYRRWRRRMDYLIAKGLKVGRGTIIEPGAILDQRSPFLIEIGNNCAIANGARLLAHDATGQFWNGGHTRLGRIHIKDNVFISENCVVLPGVTIGPNALVAAGSIVNKDIPPNSCVAGVPARYYAKFDEMLEKQKEILKTRPIFKHDDLYYGDSRAEVERCRKEVLTGDVYVQGFPGRYPFMLNPESNS